MKSLVIYHDNCADGFGAAFAAWLKFGDEAIYLPMKYGQVKEISDLGEILSEAGVHEHYEELDIYILDFSFTTKVMCYLSEYAHKLFWLDHHKSAFEMWCGGIPEDGIWVEESSATFKMDAILDNNKSGALLAWEYFHPETEVPMFIKHIDDYDRWVFALEGTKEFNKALWSYAPWSFEQWKLWFASEDFSNIMQRWQYEDFYKEGAAILRAHEQNVQAVVKGSARNCRIEHAGVEVKKDGNEVLMRGSSTGLAANCPPHLASDVGHQLANQSGTYGFLWYINKEGKCICSLRSNGDYDVSAIAKTFGGGGHRNAAGFEIDISTLLEWIK